MRAPLVRKAFELYGSCRYNLDDLVEELFRLGLRNRNGGKVTRNGLSTLLNNPFYIGLIRLKRTDEIFQGSHEPLIAKSLFDRVQSILNGKTNTRTQRHDFLFRRLLACKVCRYSLTGEWQKGHAYYRCHTTQCQPTCVREETIDEEVLRKLMPLQLRQEEMVYVRQKIAGLKQNWTKQQESEVTTLNLRISNLQQRLARLTDAFIDRLIDKDIFEERKTALLMERKDLEEKVLELKANGKSLPDRLSEFLELVESAYVSYKLKLPDEKRDFLKIATSNRQADGKNMIIKLSLPFDEIANRFENANGSPTRDIPRTWDRLIGKLLGWLRSDGPAVSGTWPLPDLKDSNVPDFGKGQNLAA